MLKALVELPSIMKNLVKQSHQVSSASNSGGKATAEEQLLMLSILVTLEAVIHKLGGFLNPLLGDTIKLMVLHPEYVSAIDKNLIKSKANAIRRLLTDKIPVSSSHTCMNLIFFLFLEGSVLNNNPSSRFVSLCYEYMMRLLVLETQAFKMLENLVVNMDRSSIVTNHGKIFDQCLVALDIRRQNPAAIQDAERSVTNAMVALTIKLTLCQKY